MSIYEEFSPAVYALRVLHKINQAQQRLGGGTKPGCPCDVTHWSKPQQPYTRFLTSVSVMYFPA